MADAPAVPCLGDFEEEGRSGCRLAQALAAVQQAGLPRAERRYLLAKAVEGCCGQPTRGGLLGLHQEVLIKASSAAGSKYTVARLQADLKNAGNKQLSTRVEKLARARHTEAHPDLELPGLVEQAVAFIKGDSVAGCGAKPHRPGPVACRLDKLEAMLQGLVCRLAHVEGFVLQGDQATFDNSANEGSGESERESPHLQRGADPEGVSTASGSCYMREVAADAGTQTEDTFGAGKISEHAKGCAEAWGVSSTVGEHCAISMKTAKKKKHKLEQRRSDFKMSSVAGVGVVLALSAVFGAYQAAETVAPSTRAKAPAATAMLSSGTTSAKAQMYYEHFGDLGNAGTAQVAPSITAEPEEATTRATGTLAAGMANFVEHVESAQPPAAATLAAGPGWAKLPTSETLASSSWARPPTATTEAPVTNAKLLVAAASAISTSARPQMLKKRKEEKNEEAVAPSTSARPPTARTEAPCTSARPPAAKTIGEELVEDVVFFVTGFDHVRGVVFEYEEHQEDMIVRCEGRCP
jgi:hypothetical protein